MNGSDQNRRPTEFIWSKSPQDIPPQYHGFHSDERDPRFEFNAPKWYDFSKEPIIPGSENWFRKLVVYSARAGWLRSNLGWFLRVLKKKERLRRTQIINHAFPRWLLRSQFTACSNCCLIVLFLPKRLEWRVFPIKRLLSVSGSTCSTYAQSDFARTQ